MYEPFAWTASTTCGKWRSDGSVSVDVNGAHLFPGLDLRVGVDVWSVRVCPGGRVDGGGLTYQKRSGGGRTLCVVLHTKVCMEMILGGSKAGERGKDDAVREGDSTDFERSEESRGLGERRHLSRVE